MKRILIRAMNVAMRRQTVGRGGSARAGRGESSEGPNDPGTLANFAAAKRSDRLLVVASGPSALLVPPGFSNADLAVLNTGFLHPEFASWGVNYYLLSGMNVHPNINLEESRAYYGRLGAHLREETFVCLNLRDRELVEDAGMLRKWRESSRVGYFDFTLAWRKRRNNLEDLNRPFQVSTGVLTMMLQLAVAAGYREILLLGVEHDHIKRYFEGRSDSNFYHHPVEGEREYLRSPAWADLWTEKGLGKVFKNLATMWEQYARLDFAARERGVRIVNITPGSLLDVFERGNYDFESGQLDAAQPPRW